MRFQGIYFLSSLPQRGCPLEQQATANFLVCRLYFYWSSQQRELLFSQKITEVWIMKEALYLSPIQPNLRLMFSIRAHQKETLKNSPSNLFLKKGID